MLISKTARLGRSMPYGRGARPRRVVPLALFAVLATMAATAGAAHLMHDIAAKVAGTSGS